MATSASHDRPPAVETSFVASSDGVNIAVHDFGGSGRLLLLCHATGFCGHVWGPVISHLRDRFHCVAIDFRGHGRSVLPDGASLDWEAMGGDFQAVVDHLSPDSPVLAVGHSMGGSAIILAETAKPGTVERAWTFEPILLRRGPVLLGADAPDIAKGARNRRARFESRAAALERYGSRPPLGLLDPRALQAYVEHGMNEHPDGGVELACRPETEAGVFENHNNGAYERSGLITIPIVIGASGDEGGPAEWATSATEEFPHLTLVSYPDLTHFGPLQEPDRLAVDIARFMGEDGAKDL